MNSAFACMSLSDKEKLIRMGIISTAVLVVFGLGYAVGHGLKAPQQEVRAQPTIALPPATIPASTPDATASTPTKIFSISSDTRRTIVAISLQFGWAMHRGKNEVALDFTVINNNANPVKEIELACAFYTKKMKPLGTRKGIIGEKIEAKASKSFNRIPVPQMTSKAEHVACEIIDAKL